ncbi:MAG: DUF3576 domain-containing protein [Alphaproteobacteria bacterium]|nr:DUF3576 domain-containing protein [Alphaproteobacteria bacterium]
MPKLWSITNFLFIIFGSILLTGCSNIEKEAKYPTGYDRSSIGGDIYAKPDSIFGGDGMKIFGGKDNENEDGASGIGVNSFLWRASLDTISFMPLASADPFGGVILTDWYSSEEAKDERFKINAFILGRQLRSDGIRVRIFKQVYKNNTWRDVTPAEGTAHQLEDTILTRARQLRIASINNE